MGESLRGSRRSRRRGLVGIVLVPLLLTGGSAQADKIKNGVAVFSGLDKITGRIISFKAGMGETVQFGSLQVTSRACFTRPAKEAPQTDTFVEVDEVSAAKQFKRIFSGWMFAASPGLHGLEHPIYDIWLTGCEKPGDTIIEAPQTADADGGAVATAPATGDVPAAGAEAGAIPAPAPDVKPKPKRVARPAPVHPAPVPSAPQPVAERREPTQRFFPASQYPSDIVGRDPAGNSNK